MLDKLKSIIVHAVIIVGTVCITTGFMVISVVLLGGC